MWLCYQHTIYFIYLFYKCFDDTFCLFKVLFDNAVRYIQSNVDIKHPPTTHSYFFPILIWRHRKQVLYKISSGNHKLYAALQRKKTVWVAQDYLFLHTVEKLLDLTSENCWNPLMLPLGCHMWNQLYLHNNNNISKAEHVRHCTSNKEDERFTVTLWLCSWPLAILLTDSLLGTNQSQFIFTAVRDFVIYIKHVACSCRASRNTRIRTVISCLKKGTDNESESEIMKSNCDSIFAYSSKRAEIVCLICRVFMNQEIDSIERLPTHSFFHRLVCLRSISHSPGKLDSPSHGNHSQNDTSSGLCRSQNTSSDMDTPLHFQNHEDQDMWFLR